MRIVTYKTAFYTFYLPAAAAMHLCGMEDPRAFDLARDICVRLGQFFQIQDDYLDCYGDPAVIGKVGTDIEDNKCSWLVVQALARCSDAQRKVFEVRRSGPGLPTSVSPDARAAAELRPKRSGEGGSHQSGVQGAQARGGVPRVREQELRGALRAHQQPGLVAEGALRRHARKNPQAPEVMGTATCKLLGGGVPGGLPEATWRPEGVAGHGGWWRSRLSGLEVSGTNCDLTHTPVCSIVCISAKV